jgi:hypothetical protein
LTSTGSTTTHLIMGVLLKYTLASDFQKFQDHAKDFQNEMQTSIEAMQDDISKLTKLLHDGELYFIQRGIQKLTPAFSSHKASPEESKGTCCSQDQSTQACTCHVCYSAILSQ